jgi:hypothetical protein
MHTALRTIGTLFFIISLFWSAGSAVLAQSSRVVPLGRHWQQTETDHFIILFDDTMRDATRHVVAIAEPIHTQVTTLRHHSPAGKTYIILTDHQDSIGGYTEALPTNKIVLNLREPGAGNVFFEMYAPDWLAMVLTHEYTHVVQSDMVQKFNAYARRIFGRIITPNDYLPMWVVEGLAVYTETKWQAGRGASGKNVTAQERGDEYSLRYLSGAGSHQIGIVCYPTPDDVAETALCP